MKRFSVITVLLLANDCLMGCGNDTSSTDAELANLEKLSTRVCDCWFCKRSTLCICHPMVNLRVECEIARSVQNMGIPEMDGVLTEFGFIPGLKAGRLMLSLQVCI